MAEKYVKSDKKECIAKAMRMNSKDCHCVIRGYAIDDMKHSLQAKFK